MQASRNPVHYILKGGRSKVLKEKEQHINENPSDQLVELRLSAMANLTDSPSTVVLMLSPRLMEGGTKGSLIHHIFPIRLSQGEGALYFRRLTAKMRGDLPTESVETAFMRHYNVAVSSVVIRVIRETISAEISVVDGGGAMLTYEDRPSSAVLMAYFCDAPIYVEKYLLQETSKSLKMNFVDENGERLSPESGERILQNAISSGMAPDDLPDGVKLLLSSSTEEQCQHLKNFAIDQELYEWAAFLTEFRPLDSGTTDKEEKE